MASFLSLSQLVAALFVAFFSVRLATLGPRSHTDAVAYSLGPVPRALPLNERITRHAEQHFKGEIVAPEHFAFHPDGDIYFGVHDGRIMRTRADPSTGALSPLETVMHTGDPRLADRGHPCGSEESEALCGRPLGMAFDRRGMLIVADCYLGLLELDVSARTSRVLVREAEGTPVYFANSVALSPHDDHDTVYFTDSSSRWRRRDFIYDIFEGQATGRLIAHKRSTGSTRVLVTGLAFANGLVVDPLAGRYLVLNELGRARLLRLDLEQMQGGGGDKQPIDWQIVQQQQKQQEGSAPGALTVLIDNLPGIPDNLAWEEDQGSGRLWVGCGTARSPPFSMTDALAPWPTLRNAMTWLLPKSAFLKFVPRVGLLLRLQLDASRRTATLLDTLQDQSGAYPLLTGAYEHRGFLYLGAISHDVDFVARIPWTQHNRSDTTYHIKQQ